MSTSITEDEAHAQRSQYPIFDRKIYLNSCSLGPLSRSSRAALDQYADDWEEFGAPAWWIKWMPRIETIRELFAQGINSQAQNVCVHHSVSSALSTIASALDYSKRNKVVVAELDFPTIAYQWLVKKGVEVVFARSDDGISIPIEEYERLIDDRTAAVATSHVFYATGALQDIKEIARIAHDRGAAAIVDGYHAFGVLPIDVNTSGVDFYVAGTLKWACGGPGLTFIYIRPELVRQTNPEISGWFASENQFAFDTLHFEPANSAGRLQLGTPAVATVYSGTSAMEAILSHKPERIYPRIQGLTDRLIEGACALGMEIASPLDRDRRGGIVMLRSGDPERLASALANENIIIDARPGKIRFSPHYFNTETDVDSALSALRDAVYSAV